MKIAYTGPNSYVGKYLKDHYGAIPIWADIRSRSETMEAMRQIQPDIVIHLAAKTDVDICEKQQKEAETVNLWGTANIADLCSKFQCNIVMLSTFQVFSGKKWFGGYTEKDKPDPVNYYGLTKMTAEAASMIYSNMKVIRTGYLFDNHRLESKIYELNEKEVSYPTFQKRSFLHLQNFCTSLMEYYIPRFFDIFCILEVPSLRPGMSLYPRFLKSSEQNVIHFQERLKTKIGFHVLTMAS